MQTRDKMKLSATTATQYKYIPNPLVFFSPPGDMAPLIRIDTSPRSDSQDPERPVQVGNRANSECMPLSCSIV